LRTEWYVTLHDVPVGNPDSLKWIVASEGGGVVVFSVIVITACRVEDEMLWVVVKTVPLAGVFVDRA